MRQERLEHITLAYRRSVGPYGEHNRRFLEDFKRELVREQLLGPSSVLLGIALDDPGRIPADRRGMTSAWSWTGIRGPV